MKKHYPPSLILVFVLSFIVSSSFTLHGATDFHAYLLKGGHQGISCDKLLFTEKSLTVELWLNLDAGANTDKVNIASTMGDGKTGFILSIRQNSAHSNSLEIRFLAKTPENIAILDKMIEKLTEVAVSSEAFNFNLPDEKGKYHQLSAYKGKYVYINFCNTQISLSKKDFGILAKYSEAYKKDLFVINIFTDENQSVMNAYVQNNKQTVINLYWNNDIDLIKKYHVINIPTYYLIDREGKFLLSPAPTPDENFEQSFEQILAKDKLKEKPEEPKDRWWE